MLLDPVACSGPRAMALVVTLPALCGKRWPVAGRVCRREPAYGPRWLPSVEEVRYHAVITVENIYHAVVCLHWLFVCAARQLGGAGPWALHGTFQSLPQPVARPIIFMTRFLCAHQGGNSLPEKIRKDTPVFFDEASPL